MHFLRMISGTFGPFERVFRLWYTSSQEMTIPGIFLTNIKYFFHLIILWYFRNFEDVENEAPIESFPTPVAFAGMHLPFVGFTYSQDHQLMTNDERPPPIPGRVSYF